MNKLKRYLLFLGKSRKLCNEAGCPSGRLHRAWIWRISGTTKIIFDSSMTVIAGILSFIFWGKLNGVREGTIIAALLVGFIARLFGKHLEFMRKFIIDDIEECVEEALN